MLYRVVHEEPHLHGVPDSLAPLLSACLAKDPEERPSTLQLSMRLKEIAAREAQGLPEARPPAQRERIEADRPTSRYPERLERTERMERPERPERGERPERRTGVRGRGRSRRAPGFAPAAATQLPPPGTAGHPARRADDVGGRRPANPRLLRQRIIVFFVVTLIVALGIAAAQQL